MLWDSNSLNQCWQAYDTVFEELTPLDHITPHNFIFCLAPSLETLDVKLSRNRNRLELYGESSLKAVSRKVWKAQTVHFLLVIYNFLLLLTFILVWSFLVLQLNIMASVLPLCVTLLGASLRWIEILSFQRLLKMHVLRCFQRTF